MRHYVGDKDDKNRGIKMNTNEINVGTKYQFRKPDGTIITAICTYKEERDNMVTADFGRFAYCSTLHYKMEYRFEFTKWNTGYSTREWTDWKDINES